MKYALVTGGTRGIGVAVAHMLAKRGFSLFLTYVSDTERAAACARRLSKDYGVRVVARRYDATDLDSITTLVDDIRDHTDRVDVVVHNAGITERTDFTDITLDQWRSVFDANIHFPTFLTRELLPMMPRGSSIVFTGSLMGIEPHAMSLSYGVTKSAVHSLVRNFVKVLQPHDIRVNGVAPGFIDTEWQLGKPEHIRRSIESKVAAGRFGDPAEVAAVYEMLIDNDYINGEIITVDGGYSFR